MFACQRLWTRNSGLTHLTMARDTNKNNGLPNTYKDKWSRPFRYVLRHGTCLKGFVTAIINWGVVHFGN